MCTPKSGPFFIASESYSEAYFNLRPITDYFRRLKGEDQDVPGRRSTRGGSRVRTTNFFCTSNGDLINDVNVRGISSTIDGQCGRWRQELNSPGGTALPVTKSSRRSANHAVIAPTARNLIRRSSRKPTHQGSGSSAPRKSSGRSYLSARNGPQRGTNPVTKAVAIGPPTGR